MSDESAPPPFPPELLDEIDGLLSRGHTVGAIKRVRDATGCDLKTAKDAVDAYRAAHPDRFPAAARGKGGCGGAAALLAVLAVLVVAAVRAWGAVGHGLG